MLDMRPPATGGSPQVEWTNHLTKCSEDIVMIVMNVMMDLMIIMVLMIVILVDQPLDQMFRRCG